MNNEKKDKKTSKKKVIDIIVTIVACVIDLCVCIYTISNIHNNINIMKQFSILFVVNVLYFNYIMLCMETYDPQTNKFSAKTRDERINFIKIEILILVCLGFLGLLSMLFGSHSYFGLFDFSS